MTNLEKLRAASIYTKRMTTRTYLYDKSTNMKKNAEILLIYNVLTKALIDKEDIHQQKYGQFFKT